jgi:thiopurine S-methyltransferase
MSNRDDVLWLQCWRDQQIDFHQHSVNHLLTRFWPTLDLAFGSRVFVPLCGKSLDMIWLAGQGHQVVGVELSEIAVAAFFRENGLKPNRRQVGQFTLWQHGRISIFCGDYFALSQADLENVETVYDRAALTALPEDIRQRYVSHLRKITAATSQIFLLTTEDAAENETLIQSLAVNEEIKSLYAYNFRIDLAHVESVFELDPDAPDDPPERAEHKLYRLSNHAAA